MLKEEYGTMKKFACLVVLVVSCMAAFATVSTHAAKSPCREITFEPLPMKFGDSAQRGTPYAKDPTVIRHDGRYLMYYSVRNCDKDHFHEGDDPIRLKSWWGAVAESTNLVDWTRIGDIEISGSRFISAAVAPCVKKIDGKIHMFHQARRQPCANAGDWVRANKDDLIWHATSEDGVHFVSDGQEPAFAPSNKWSRRVAIDAEVYRTGNRLMLMYVARDPSNKWQMLGMAWAKYGGGYGGGKWTELTIDAPFFRPELPWEMHCIEAPTVVERNGIWYMFYAGAYNHERQQIGVAWSADGVKFTRYRDEPVFPHGEKGAWNEWESGHPGLFVDDDGQCYLFFQGKATLNGDYSLSCAKVRFVD